MKKKVTIVLAVLLVATMAVVILTACNSNMSKKAYDDIICATEGNNFVASKDGKFYLFNLKGKQLSPGYDLELSLTDGDYLLGRNVSSFGYDLLSSDGSVLLQSSADFRISEIEITTDIHAKGMVGSGSSSDYTIIEASQPAIFATVSAKNNSGEDVSELYFFNSAMQVPVSDSEVQTITKTDSVTANGVREGSSVTLNVVVVKYRDNADGVLISSVEIYDLNGTRTATYNPGNVDENDFTDVYAQNGRLFIDGDEKSYLVPYTMSGDLIDVTDCYSLRIGEHDYLYKLLDLANVKFIDLENDSTSIKNGESCTVVGDYIKLENDGTYYYYDEKIELKKTLDYSVTSYADGVYYVGGQKLLNANLEEKIVDFGGFSCSYVDGDDVYGLYTTTVSGSTELFYCNKGASEGVGISSNASITANGRYARIVDGERIIVFDLKTKRELNNADSEITAITPDDDSDIYVRASDEELRIYYGGNYDTYSSDEDVQYTLLSTKVERYDAEKDLEKFGLYSVTIQKSTDSEPTNIYIMRVNDNYEIVYRGSGRGSLTYGSFNLSDKKMYAAFSVAGECEGLAANVKVYDLSINYSDDQADYTLTSEDYTLTLNSAKDLLIPNAGIKILGEYLVASNDVNGCNSIYDMNGTLKVGPKFVVESIHGNYAVVYIEPTYESKPLYGVIEITKKGYKMKEDLKYTDISGFGNYYIIETEKDGITHNSLKTFDGDKLVKDSLGIMILEEKHMYINDAKATIAVKVFDGKGWKVLFMEFSAYNIGDIMG